MPGPARLTAAVTPPPAWSTFFSAPHRPAHFGDPRPGLRDRRGDPADLRGGAPAGKYGCRFPDAGPARQLYPENCLVCANGEQLPLPPDSLDLVTIGQAVHWFNLPALVGELKRVLRPGGWLAVISRYPSPAGRCTPWWNDCVTPTPRKAARAPRSGRPPARLPISPGWNRPDFVITNAPSSNIPWS